MADHLDDSFFRSLCVHAGVALIATDERHLIRFWNEAATRTLGGGASDMIGRPFSVIVPEEHRELAQRLCQRCLSRGEVSEFEFQHRNMAGDPIHLAVTMSPITAADERRIGVSVFVRDVTRRIDLERGAAANQKMAALGALAGQVAHHFNNLLGGIITSLDFAQNSDDPQQLQRAMRMTITALTRANLLTQGLLSFAEGDRSDSVLGQLTWVVRRFADDLRPRLLAEGIRLELDLEPVEGRVPVKRVTTILEHLTANAREAMTPGGALRIELKPLADEAKAILRVADTGCGIPTEHLPHVFEPFFTTKCTPCDAAKHSGLGLAVVHGIVKEMGGSATLCSTANGGTVCSVLLPLAAGK